MRRTEVVCSLQHSRLACAIPAEPLSAYSTTLIYHPFFDNAMEIMLRREFFIDNAVRRAKAPVALGANRRPLMRLACRAVCVAQMTNNEKQASS